MNDDRRKLFTRKTYLYIIVAISVGAAWPLVREYRQTHTLKILSIIISFTVLGMGVGITAIIGWWGNRPE